MFADSSFTLAAGAGVFVRLQDWINVTSRHVPAARPWTGPAPERPPYPIDTTHIVKYYQQIGAAVVNVQLMSHHALTQLRSSVEAVLAKPLYRPQFESNLNMLLLRHLVYQDMLDYEKSHGVRYRKRTHSKEREHILQ